jgi:hypothetical protein
MRADLLVLLDNVQYPRGQSWVNRNRVKGPEGAIWLTVPVKKKGRGLQSIGDVEVFSERAWSRDHLLTLRHAYGNAPYYNEYAPFFEEVYTRAWTLLNELNSRVLGHLKDLIGVSSDFVPASSLGVKGLASQLLVDVCEKTGCTTYLVSRSARKYLDEKLFKENGIDLLYCSFAPPIYPQLWGDFVPNLSIVDMLFNCGPKSLEILDRFARR